MKCIVLLVIIVIAQYEGTTGLPRHTILHDHAGWDCEEIFASQNEHKEGRGLSQQNICAYLKCKWNRIQNTYQQFQKKLEDFINGLTHGSISNKIPPYDITKINITEIVFIPNKPIDNQQPTPAKTDDKKTKPEDNKDPLTSQDATSSEETSKLENGTQTSLAPDESTVNQKSTPIENNGKEQEQLPNVTEKTQVQKDEILRSLSELYLSGTHPLAGKRRL